MFFRSFAFVIQFLVFINVVPCVGQIQIGQELWGREPGGQFGYSVALSGDGQTLLVGAPFAAVDSGYYQRYSRLGSGWVLEPSPTSNQGTLVGFAVDVSDEATLLGVGQPGENLLETHAGSSGRYITSEVSQISDTDGFFGSSLSLSGNGKVLAIGARSADEPREDAGFVGIWNLDDTIWSESGHIQSSLGHVQLGWSVDLSYDGTILAVGSPSSIGNLRTGRVDTYELVEGSWRRLGNPVLGGQDLFGYALALSSKGDRLVVGAPSGQGYVKVYSLEDKDWRQDATFRVPGSSSTGLSVDISGDGSRLVYSSLGSNSTAMPGIVMVEDFENDQWIASGLYRGSVGEAFGWSVSLSADGESLAIGTPGADGAGLNNAGRVEVYGLGGTTSQHNLRLQDIGVGPNPTTNRVEVTGNGIDPSGVLRLYDATSQLLYESRSTSINLGGLPAGLYFLQVPTRGKGSSTTFRVMRL